mgnify:CR=1 FL=1
MKVNEIRIKRNKRSQSVFLMTDGKIVADGPAEEILTNPKLLAKASVISPQITQIFMKLERFGLSTKVIDVYKAREIIVEHYKSKVKK